MRSKIIEVDIEGSDRALHTFDSQRPTSILAVSTATQQQPLVDGRDAPQGRARALASVAAAPRAPAQPPLRCACFAATSSSNYPAAPRSPHPCASSQPRRRRADQHDGGRAIVLARALAAGVGAAAVRVCRRGKCGTASCRRAPASSRSAEHALAIDASGDVHVIGGGVGRRSSKGDACRRARSAGWTVCASCRSRAAPRTRCSSSHAAARRGEVHAVGENSCGQLGLGHHGAAAAAAASHRAVRARRLARRGGCGVVVRRRGGGDARGRAATRTASGPAGARRRTRAPCASAAAPATPAPSPASRCTPRPRRRA